MSNLAETMRAIVCHNPGDYRLEEVERPHARQGEVIIEVKACGICAGDVKVFQGGEMFWQGSALTAPVIPGHEFYGRVVELGAGAAEKFKITVGDLITAEQIVPCGQCKFCQEGNFWMCREQNIYGFQQGVAEGGMAEYMRLGRTSRIYKLPEELTLQQASIVEPLSCALHAVQRAEIEFGDFVVLAGAGPLGLCMVQLISRKNPGKLVVLDLNEKRLEIARRLGADYCFNPAREDVITRVKELTAGYGCDIYIEAVGAPASVRQGLAMIRNLGRFVEFGLFVQETSANWSIIGDGKELDIRGVHLSAGTYPVAIDLLQRGLISADEIVSRVYEITKFDQAMEDAQSLDTIKILVKP